MKVNLLKELIKEAVREVIREELQFKDLNEVKINPSLPQSMSKTSTEVKTVPSSINEALNLTRNSMTREDFSNIIGTNSTVIESIQPVSNLSTGVDLSSLDFVEKASTIFNLSKEKDKSR
jgi:hypothetical protein